MFEFFFVENSTEEDQYCIMCTIAKNFEALIKEIYERNPDKNPIENDINTHYKSGLFYWTGIYKFDDFHEILNRDTRIWTLEDGSYKKTLKVLSFVRNSDAHGQWYFSYDRRTDTRPEQEKNLENTKRFAALYIFAVAKYLICQ